MAPFGRTASSTRWIGVAIAVPVTVLAAIGLLPDLLGLDRRPMFVQLVSFRPQLVGLAMLVLALAAVVVRGRRPGWPVLAGLLAVIVLATGQLLPRMIPDSQPTAGTPFTVLAFNTFEGRADVGVLAELIRTERPDVVSLPEAGAHFTSRLRPLLEPLRYRLQSSADSGADVENVSVAVAGELGDVQVRVGAETSIYPYLELSGGRLGALRVVAFHAAAPVPGQIENWQADQALLQRWCSGPGPTVVAGDMNATLDHSALRTGTAGCQDAAAERGQGLVPTWGPSPRARLVGPQIDHVFGGGGIATAAFSVHDVPGSDHRAVLARLLLPS
ncbi:MAG TPA: endonuclease/exonuclease/phosphatase family protein [Pseudonocardia sp.]|nr:endonuclease/exonuclease/phosphatase family protein [Pseudonocardia sp.]